MTEATNPTPEWFEMPARPEPGPISELALFFRLDPRVDLEPEQLQVSMSITVAPTLDFFDAVVVESEDKVEAAIGALAAKAYTLMKARGWPLKITTPIND